MKKLKLDLETLDVESFAATRKAMPVLGTVRGHDATERFCPWYTDPGNGTGPIESGPLQCSSVEPYC